MTTSMDEQLRELYRDKETFNQHFPGLSSREIIDLTRSVQSQLDALYEEQIDLLIQERERLHNAFPGMTIDEIIDLARAGMLHGGDASAPSEESAAVAASMEAQLIALYQEREQLSAAFPGMTAEEIVRDISSKIQRLETLYANAA